MTDDVRLALAALAGGTRASIHVGEAARVLGPELDQVAAHLTRLEETGHVDASVLTVTRSGSKRMEHRYYRLHID